MYIICRSVPVVCRPIEVCNKMDVCFAVERYMAGEALDPRGTKKIHIEDKLLAISGIRPVGPTVRRLTTDQEIPRSNRGQDYPLLGN